MVTQEEQDKKLASDQAEVGAANIIPQGQAASSASGVPPATDSPEGPPISLAGNQLRLQPYHGNPTL